MTLPLLLLTLLAVPAQETAVQPEPVVTSAPIPATPSIATGLELFRKRRFRQAEAEFQKAVEADPQNAAAHFYLGYTLYKISEPTKRLTAEKQRAAEEFARAYALDPLFQPVWARRAS
jgi:Tfp pilus assembly protein PilF